MTKVGVVDKGDGTDKKMGVRNFVTTRTAAEGAWSPGRGYLLRRPTIKKNTYKIKI